MNRLVLLKKYTISVVTIASLFTISGCGTWRVVPSHGGGKRFDEEQRVVAGSIRTAIAEMNLEELNGKKVSFEVSSLSHDGGGQVTNPGLNYLSGNISDFDTLYLSNGRDYNRAGWQVNASYSTQPNFRPTVFRSQSDMDYFLSSLALKMRMSGLDFVNTGGAVTLYVIVDILGTNLSTEDAVVAWTEKLRATCEFTYYAVDKKTNKMLFEPRSVRGASEYIDHSSFFYINNGNEFRMMSESPTGFPIDGESYFEAFGSNSVETIKHDTPDKAETNNDINDLKAKVQLADSYIGARNFEAAERLINEILEIDPNNPNISALRSRLKNEKQNALQDASQKIKDND